jgi:hypothetical protein
MTPPPKRKAKPANTIAFQGEPGAYSHLACTAVYPDMTPLPCATFEGALAAVQTGKAALGMIPIENSVAGRVADIHHLMPHSGLFIIAEHFQPVRHCLLGPKGSTLKTVKYVHSHVQAHGLLIKVLGGADEVLDREGRGEHALLRAERDGTLVLLVAQGARLLVGRKQHLLRVLVKEPLPELQHVAPGRVLRRLGRGGARHARDAGAGALRRELGLAVRGARVVL